MPPAPELTVVLPVHDEAPVLPELNRRLGLTLDALGLRYRILYVDDGSLDGSTDLLRRLAEADDRVAVLVLSRSFGHQPALSAGIDHASGDALVLMDSDLQDPPELIPELVARWREGYDVVSAQRRSRPGESLFKRATAYAFYRVFRWLTGVVIPEDAGDFRLLSRRVADVLRVMPERRRFLRGLVTWAGFRQVRVPYDRGPRPAGESKYSLGQMTGLALVGLFSFGERPLGCLGGAGLLVCAGALVALTLGAEGWKAGLFLLGGLQLLAAWMLGQYALGAAEESRGRPLYVVRDAVNLPPRRPEVESPLP